MLQSLCRLVYPESSTAKTEIRVQRGLGGFGVGGLGVSGLEFRVGLEPNVHDKSLEGGNDLTSAPHSPQQIFCQHDLNH